MVKYFFPFPRSRPRMDLTREALRLPTAASMFCAIPLSMASLPETPSPPEDADDELLPPQGLPRFRGASSASRAAKMWPSPPRPMLRACRTTLVSCGRQLKLLQWRASTRMGARRKFRRWCMMMVRVMITLLIIERSDPWMACN